MDFIAENVYLLFRKGKVLQKPVTLTISRRYKKTTQGRS